MTKSLAQARRKAKTIVNSWTAGATSVSWVPGSSLVLGAADYGMIRSVAKTFGVEDYDSEAVVATIGAGSVGKMLAAEAVGLIPVAGWAVKAGIAGGMTKALGEGIIKYFEARSPYR